MQTNCIFRRNAKINIMGAASFFGKINKSTGLKGNWNEDFAGISETAGVQQGRDGRSAFINFSLFLATFLTYFYFFFFFFPLNFLPFTCWRQIHQYLVTNLSWLRREWFPRNVLEDSFLTNTIPEFDPSPPQVIQAPNW